MTTKAEREKRAADKAAARERNIEFRDREIERDMTRRDAVYATNHAAIKKLCHNPAKMAAAHKQGKLPEWFKRLLGECRTAAEEIATEAAREAYQRVYIESYAKTLPGLLRDALAALPDPTA